MTTKLRIAIALIVLLSATIALAWVKLSTPLGFNSKREDEIQIISPEGRDKGGFQVWKYRDGPTTCFVFVIRSGDHAWMPSSACSLFFL